MTGERSKGDRNAPGERAGSDAGMTRTLDDSVAAGEAPRRIARRDATLPVSPAASPEDRYDVEAEHARGGFGVILRARDVHLERPIAIKELGDTTSPRAVDRFVREALIAARLQHPGIVPVYDAGRWGDGSPYYSMRLVSGRTLREEIAARPTLEHRLALVPGVLAVAEAVGYAHAEGVIHRDLKPDNVMIGAFGETVVLDWGLAKDRRRAELAADDGYGGVHADATRRGAILGTPAYMAPEQARGEDLDERTDVWAIGAILYHVLAAAPPFDGPADVVIRRAASERPASLVERAPGAPRDLRAIVDKAMARDPAARYANAKLLADDLSRFLTGQLVGAREYSRPALLARWVRRRRAPVAVAAILLVVLGATVAFSIRRIVGELRRVPLDGAPPTALLDGAVLQKLDGQLGALAVDRDARTLVIGIDDRVLRWQRGAPAPVELGRHRSAVKVIVISDAGRVVSGAEDGSITSWDGAGPRPLQGHVHAITALGFGGDGQLVSGDTSGDVRLWTSTGSQLLRGHDGRIESLAFGGDDTLYTAGGDGSVRAWPARPAPKAIRVGTGSVFRIAFVSPEAIAATDEDGGVRLISLATGDSREIARFTRQAYGIQRLPGGRFATASWDGSIVVFGPTGDPQRRFDHGAEINDLAASPDGTRLASTAVDGSVRMWNLETGDARVIERRPGAALDVVFSPDGRTLVTSGADRELHVFDLIDGGPPRSFRGHTDVARSLTFSRDGKTLYSAGGEGVVRGWDLATGASRAYTGHEGRVRTVALSPDQRYLASGGADGTIIVWDLAQGDRPIVFRGHTVEVRHVAFALRGALLASAGWDGTVRLWNLEDGGVTVWHADDDKVQRVEFSPDGSLVASAGADGTVRLWRVDDQRLILNAYRELMAWMNAQTSAVIDNALGSIRPRAVTTLP